VSPNSYTRQLWVSARMSSHKFDWSDETGEFALSGTGEALKQVMMRLTQEQLGDSNVTL
jgi:frataxin-like iron-binding protein CyaY